MNGSKLIFALCTASVIIAACQGETETDCKEYQYVHIWNPFIEHPGQTTCETLGFESIKAKVECYNASKTILAISDYTQQVPDPECHGWSPNHCFSNTNDKVVYFTPDHCPVHAGPTQGVEGYICKTCRGVFSLAIVIIEKCCKENGIPSSCMGCCQAVATFVQATGSSAPWTMDPMRSCTRNPPGTIQTLCSMQGEVVVKCVEEHINEWHSKQKRSAEIEQDDCKDQLPAGYNDAHPGCGTCKEMADGRWSFLAGGFCDRDWSAFKFCGFLSGAIKNSCKKSCHNCA